MTWSLSLTRRRRPKPAWYRGSPSSADLDRFSLGGIYTAPLPALTEPHCRRRAVLDTQPVQDVLAARGATPSAFERRSIPSGCVAPPSNIPDILGRRALPAGRLAVLGATMDLHHGLLECV